MSRHADCCRGKGANVGKADGRQRRLVELEQHRRCRQFVLLAPARMQLADMADADAVDLDPRTASGMQRRMCRCNEDRPARRAERLDVALDVVEVDGAFLRAPTAAARLRRRRGRRCAPAGGHRRRRGPVGVPSGRAGTRVRPRTPGPAAPAGRDSCAARRSGCRRRLERMTDSELAIGLSTRIGSALPARSLLPALLDEAEVDGLAVAEPDDALAQRIGVTLRFARHARRQRRRAATHRAARRSRARG